MQNNFGDGQFWNKTAKSTTNSMAYNFNMKSSKLKLIIFLNHYNLKLTQYTAVVVQMV